MVAVPIHGFLENEFCGVLGLSWGGDLRDGSDGICHVERERERERSFEIKKGYTQPKFFTRDFRLRVGMVGCQRGRHLVLTR